MLEVELTLSTLSQICDEMKAGAIPPRVVQSQAEADALNEYGREVGLSRKWKVGDEYYLLVGADEGVTWN